MRRIRPARLPLIGLATLALSVGAAEAAHEAIDTEGHTTLEQILTATAPGGYTTLDATAVSDAYIVRDPLGVAEPTRADTRTSLAYVAQLTDFQLADEESPARVEFLDAGANSAWRPQEAFHPFLIDASIRQINRFAGASPVPQGNTTGNAMDFTIATGDQADNQQRNEMVWVRELMEGGDPLRFGSGIRHAAGYKNPLSLGASCPAFVANEGSQQAAAQEGRNYTGVQDYDDYPFDPGSSPAYYDPDDVRGSWADDGWPSYPGLMDRAQNLVFTPEGLDVPFYVTNGNHDALVQGNEDANQAFELIVTGCFKALGTTAEIPAGLLAPSSLLAPNGGMLVPPDPKRRFVSRREVKTIFGHDDPVEKHGFGFVNSKQNQASRQAADYYAWDPVQTPGVRFISISTNSEGGVLGPFGPQPTGSSDGNIDNPQFNWLERQLDQADADGQLVVIFGHHPVRTLDAAIPDELASPCTIEDKHGHDINPGCDLDPRLSTPLHFGTPEQAAEFLSGAKTFVELIAEHPNVIAYVAGHTHEHAVIPFERGDGTMWWELGTSATADWPQQHRLIEVMDNTDGTLSIFGTVLDAAAPATAPAPGSAALFGVPDLASIGRTFAYNDPQNNFSGEGQPEDRNVELLLPDPR